MSADTRDGVRDSRHPPDRREKRAGGAGTRLDGWRRMQAHTRSSHRSASVVAFTAALVLALLAWAPRRARADPLFGAGQNALEDAYLDGELDGEDHAALRLGSHVGTSDAR